MKSYCLFPVRVGRWLVVAAGLVLTGVADAQTTNWVAFNDHLDTRTPGPTPPWSNAPTVTTFPMGAPENSSGSLINFLTGAPLSATVTFTRTGAPDYFGAIGHPLRTNTPMARIFLGICDLETDGLVGVRAVPPNTTESYVTTTFSGLDPSKRYVFRGSVARNGGYGTRWSVASISAAGWTDAHINGTPGPGILTINSFPASGLAAGQAAHNSGANPEGSVVGWNDIAPFPDGTFSITNQQYTGAIPGGTANGPVGYSLVALMLAEVEIVAPTITANPPASTTVEQNRPFSLSVAASGTPLNYEWYKGDVAIPGATLATYSVAQAQVSDSGQYYAVVYNSLARRTSTVAQVTVFADTTAPTVEAIFSYPTVDAGGAATLDQIIIEWNEPVTSASVSSPASYTLSGGGNPASVIVTNERSVVLVLATPLAEDTDYSVTLSGATDAVGNVAGSSSPSLHSWVSGIGNGLLMESFNVEDPDLLAESVLRDPDYPNNPFRRDTLRAFDTRLVFPDNTREGYGARISGVFIPPVSGEWRFFARMPVFGILYLNPNGTAEAGKVEIVRQSTQNAPYPWDRLQSSLVSLRAGRAYYIEGLYKNVTGADYFKVAARLAGTGAPLPVDSPDTDAPDANSMAGGYIAFPLAPRDLGGPLTIQQDLVNITAEENNLTTFALQLNNPSLLPLQYQWFRNGSPIPGANGPTYTIQPTIAGDNGATFSVQVAKVGSAVTSRTATLTVVPDVTRPRVIEVISSPTNLSVLTVRFNELMNAGQLEDPFNFNINPIDVPSSVAEPDGMTGTVNLGEPLVLGSSYQLTISTLSDLAGLVIDPNPTVITFTAGGGRPRLSIALSGNNAVLSWPAPSTGFVLEQADQIVEPVSAIVWTPVGGTPQVVNGRNTQSVPAGPNTKVFRLRQ